MVWWENQMGETTYNDAPIVKLLVRCPVCKVSLGRKETDETVAFHCDECLAVFTWFPGVDKPTAKLDRDLRKVCKCPGCRAERGEEEMEESPKVWQSSGDCDDIT